MIQALRFPLWALLLAVLALTGCQSAPPKGLSAEQIAVLKREGFTPTDEGWAYDLSGKVLFGSDLEDGAFQASGIIGSIVGAIIALLVWRAVRSRGEHRGHLGRA